ncbi:hypothetical protein [Massilia sp. CCM 8734]|uniref:hypothetical protein n=1 Tax=Massilia sp. CCM 8734 TaxID=2609283 RepID=UPI00141DDC47|nr:hypothetical protein [Massilia sp. CCM 8734]NHZ97945.1 hypothetical protein [Massilia sp. CCM 8734]
MTQQQVQASQAQAAPGTDASALGALIASYDKGFPAAKIGWCVAVLLFAFGVFIFRVASQAHPDSAPDNVVYGLYAFGFAAMALAIGLGYLVWQLNAAQPAYYVFEHGIRTCDRDGEQTALYCDIEDVFSSNFVVLAFRISPRTPWIFLGNYPEQSAVLKELHRRHMMERFANLFQQTLHGHTVVFRYFTRWFWLTKKTLMNYPASEITLNKQQLTIGDKSITIDRIGDIQQSFWSQKATIMDKDGVVFHTMHGQAVLSFDVLLGVLRGLQHFHSTQPTPQ